jgi:DNA-binding beta-propeller fold protein YncE
MSHTLIQGLRAFGRSATRSAQKPRRRTGRLLAVAAGAVVASSVFVPSADAAPGDLTFAGCIGDLAGCTATNPATALEGGEGVAVSGLQLYSVSSAAVSHFMLDAAGNANFAGCIGIQPGCTPAPFIGANAVTVTPDGKQLYTTTEEYIGGAVSHYTIDAAGNLTFAGCIGRVTSASCTPTFPPGALDGAEGVAVTADGQQLYATSEQGNVVSHFRIDAAGNLISAGCIGDLAGCTATTPKTALDGADGVTVSAAGGDLYATAGTGAGAAVSHFKIVGAGDLRFAGCIGDLAGCTATTPKTALDGADGVAVSNDGANLYATSFFGNSVSHFTIAAFTFSR